MFFVSIYVEHFCSRVWNFFILRIFWTWKVSLSVLCCYKQYIHCYFVLIIYNKYITFGFSSSIDDHHLSFILFSFWGGGGGGVGELFASFRSLVPSCSKFWVDRAIICWMSVGLRPIHKTFEEQNTLLRTACVSLRSRQFLIRSEIRFFLLKLLFHSLMDNVCHWTGPLAPRINPTVSHNTIIYLICSIILSPPPVIRSAENFRSKNSTWQ